MADIFISYRREDAGHAGRLYDRLSANNSVMMDVDVSPGRDFTDQIETTVSSSKVVIVVIGPNWFSSSDRRGERRLENPNDFVRLEIATALSRGLRVIPVLVGGAHMPRPNELPADIKGLVRLNALEITDDRWDYFVERLNEALQPFTTESPRRDSEKIKSRKAPKTQTEVDTPSSLRTEEGHQIFISYASEDAELAEIAVETIETNGYKCWIAARDIPPGTSSYARSITKAIKTSRLMVVVVSQHSNQSEDVLNEITLAKNNKVTRLPFRIDNAPLDDGFEYFFSQAQWLDASEKDRDEAIAELVRAISLRLGSARGASQL